MTMLPFVRRETVGMVNQGKKSFSFNLLMAIAGMIVVVLNIGCSDLLSLDPATIDGEINVPDSAWVYVLTDSTAKIVFHASNEEDNFRGYVLLQAMYDKQGDSLVLIEDRDTLIDSLVFSSGFTGDTSFKVSIIQDSSMSWKVGAYNKSGEVTTRIIVKLAPRKVRKNQTLAWGDTTTRQNGLILGERPTIVALSKGRSIDFEIAWDESSARVFGLNGAVVINCGKDSSAYFSIDDINKARDSFSENRAVKVGNTDYFMTVSDSTLLDNGIDGEQYQPSVGDVLIVSGKKLSLTDNYYIAKLIVKSVVKGKSVKFDIYYPNTNKGNPLY